MTQLKKKYCPNCGFDLDPISNHFDNLFKGIGKGGSSFMDIDALIHNGRTNPARFLMLEFKHKDEKFEPAVEWVLEDFAKNQPTHLAIAIRCLGEDKYRVRFYPDKTTDVVNGRALRGILKHWWNVCQPIPTIPERTTNEN